MDTPPANAFGPTRAVGVALLAVWVFLSWTGVPHDAAAIAGVIGLVAGVSVAMKTSLGERAVTLLKTPTTRNFVVGAAIAAAVVSYVLGGGPMRSRPLSIDAVVYLLQARALSHGHFGAVIPEPRQLFGARFLFEGADGRLHGVFPPGFPLFLVPFAVIGVPMLAGPVTAALLVIAQWLLGRAIEGEDGVATRLAIVLSIPSFARAIETSDLLSHAFVAALGTAAVALALLVREKATTLRMLAIGALLGWATSARFLDGLVIGVAVAGILVHAVATRRVTPAQLLLPIVSFVPFVALVLAQNRAASGSWLVPNQSTYFMRSDWPTHCHRLGFGWDVGCAVEHNDERKSFGPDGYGPGDALRIVRERAGVIGGDLFGFGPLMLVALGAVLLTSAAVDLWLAMLVIGFTVAYGLFYYGNAPMYGARHLFPIAPIAWLLAARAVSAKSRFERAPMLGLALAMFASFVPRWMFGMGAVSRAQESRLDLRGVIDRAGLDRGLIVTGDDFAWLAAFDPAADGDARVLVRFDGSGLKDLRRLHPEWPVHAVLEGEKVQTQQMPPVPPGLMVELDRAWPSYVRPFGVDAVGTRVINAKTCCKVEASGERVLYVFHANPGSTFEVPFTAPVAGRFALRVDGMSAPDYGTWSISVDGHPLPAWDGWSKDFALKRGTPSEPVELGAGRHVLRFSCAGKNPESTGYRGSFDTLIGAP